MKSKKNLAPVATADSKLKMDHKELVKYLNQSNKVIASVEKQFEDILDEKERYPDKAELIIEALTAEKKIIDELSDNLVAAVNAEYEIIARDLKSRMLPHLKRYNALVAEYLNKTGGRLTEAPLSIPDDIIARREYAVLPILSYSRMPVGEQNKMTPDDMTHALEVLSIRDFRRYVANTDMAMKPVRDNLQQIKFEIKKARGQEKAILIIKALGYQKTIIESNIELCHAAMNTRTDEEVFKTEYRLECDVRDYNELVDQYEKLTGSTLTRASTSLPKDVVSGKDYQALPTVTCTVNDPTDFNYSEKDYKNAKKNIRNKTEQMEQVVDAAVEAKITEQAEKDIKVLEHCANMRKHLVESERDAKCYRFGMTSRQAKKAMKEYNKDIKDIVEDCTEACEYEHLDNDRYYTVVRLNPEAVSYPNPKADVMKLRAIRSEVIALLNKRDEINSKLISIYAGTKISSDGKSVDKRWTDIKKEASEFIIKRDKRYARKIEKLPATHREKQVLFDMMNKKLDAESTCALLEDRLHNGRKLSREEKKQIKADIRTQRGNVDYWEDELNRAVSDIKKRAEKVKNSGYFEPI